MTAALYDEVVTVAPARTLTVVRDTDTIQAPAPKKVTRRVDNQPFGLGGDPLVDGAARLLSIARAPRVRGAVAGWCARSPGIVEMDSEQSRLQGATRPQVYP